MRNEEIKELTTKEIRDYIKDEKLNFSRMRLSHAVSPLDNPQKIRNTKKFVARLKTELRTRELKESKQK